MHLLQDKTLHGQNKYVAPAGAAYFFALFPRLVPTGTGTMGYVMSSLTGTGNRFVQCQHGLI